MWPAHMTFQQWRTVKFKKKGMKTFDFGQNLEEKARYSQIISTEMWRTEGKYWVTWPGRPWWGRSPLTLHWTQWRIDSHHFRREKGMTPKFLFIIRTEWTPSLLLTIANIKVSFGKKISYLGGALYVKKWFISTLGGANTGKAPDLGKIRYLFLHRQL